MSQAKPGEARDVWNYGQAANSGSFGDFAVATLVRVPASPTVLLCPHCQRGSMIPGLQVPTGETRVAFGDTWHQAEKEASKQIMMSTYEPHLPPLSEGEEGEAQLPHSHLLLLEL